MARSPEKGRAKATDRARAQDALRDLLSRELGPIYSAKPDDWLTNFTFLRQFRSDLGIKRDLQQMRELTRQGEVNAEFTQVFDQHSRSPGDSAAVRDRIKAYQQRLGNISRRVNDGLLVPGDREFEWARGLRHEMGLYAFQDMFPDIRRPWVIFANGDEPESTTTPESRPSGDGRTREEARGVEGPTQGAGGDALDITEVPGGLGGSESDGAAPPGGGPAGTPSTPAGGDAGTPGGAEGGPRQIPGGGQLWKVDNKFYLAYRNPKHAGLWMTWEVENTERLDAIYGDALPQPDKNLTAAQYKALGPWRGGLSAELVVTDRDPWQVFNEQLRTAAELRPWILDPSVQAVMQVAYLEDRDPTADELALTDWWNNHTADERAWMEDSVTLGDKEVQRRKNDAKRSMAETLRAGGMASPPDALVEFLATQRLTGRWSADYAAEQVRKVSDPFAPGTLDRGIVTVLTNLEFGNAGDLQAVSQGRDAVLSRVRDIFDTANVPIATADETEEQRLNRVTDEVWTGKRTMKSVRDSVNIQALEVPGGIVGGIDVTSEGEDRVRTLLREWVGPAVASQYTDRWVKEWAGRLRNDPDATRELTDLLRQARVGAFSNWTDTALRYEDIAPVARSLFNSVWGQSMDETDPLFLDIVNQPDRVKAAALLRQEGMKRNVGKVWQDATSGFEATPVGERVIRSTI